MGVQRGTHALQFLKKWRGARLYLVDRWENVPSNLYVDIANIQNVEMEKIKSGMVEKLAEEFEFEDRNSKLFYSNPKIDTHIQNGNHNRHRYVVLPMWSQEAAETIPDGTLDFVYLDARHDFGGVFADLKSWWPKLRRGGTGIRMFKQEFKKF